LRRISGIDPSKARSKFKRHIAGAIGDLSKEITSEVKKAVEDLTKQGNVKNKKNKKFLEERIEITDDNGIINLLTKQQRIHERADTIIEIEKEKNGLEARKAKAEKLLLGILDGSRKVPVPSFERCVVLDSNGEFVSFDIGEQHRVFVKSPNGALKNGFVAHTHPSASPPSPSDLRLFFNEDLKEFLTVTRYGTIRFVRKQPKPQNVASLIYEYELFVEHGFKKAKEEFEKLDKFQQSKYKIRAYYHENIEIGARYEFIYDKLLSLFGDIIDISYRRI